MMFTEDMRNSMRLEAQRAVGRLAMPRVGLISAYDNNNGVHNVKVQFPEDLDSAGNPLETGWIPNAPVWHGGGWGLYVGPVIGQQVVVSFLGGSFNSGYVSAHIPSRGAPAPQVPSNEFWLVHSTGAYVKINGTGQVLLRDSAGSSLTLNGDNTITLAGQSFTFNGQHFTVNASTDATIQTPILSVSNELDVGTGPIKQNGVTVAVP